MTKVKEWKSTLPSLFMLYGESAHFLLPRAHTVAPAFHLPGDSTPVPMGGFPGFQ